MPTKSCQLKTGKKPCGEGIIIFGMDLELLDQTYNLKQFFMMTTLSGVLEKLRIRKQDNEFIITDGGFGSPAGKVYNSEDLTIIKTYRFEGESDPSDSSILYLIEATDGLIGYSIDAYGVYSNHDDSAYDEFIRKIHVSEREEQEIFN